MTVSDTVFICAPPNPVLYCSLGAPGGVRPAPPVRIDARTHPSTGRGHGPGAAVIIAPGGTETKCLTRLEMFDIAMSSQKLYYTTLL